VHGRVEDFQPKEKFELIISRAFSEIALFIKLTRHLLAANGKWLAMKGSVPHQELAGVVTNKTYPLAIAGLEAERHLIVIENH
jgi:16S rRNA (guanine527-N7)-methyltransferase